MGNKNAKAVLKKKEENLQRFKAQGTIPTEFLESEAKVKDSNSRTNRKKKLQDECTAH